MIIPCVNVVSDVSAASILRKSYWMYDCIAAHFCRGRHQLLAATVPKRERERERERERDGDGERVRNRESQKARGNKSDTEQVSREAMLVFHLSHCVQNI